MAQNRPLNDVKEEIMEIRRILTTEEFLKELVKKGGLSKEEKEKYFYDTKMLKTRNYLAIKRKIKDAFGLSDKFFEDKSVKAIKETERIKNLEKEKWFVREFFVFGWKKKTDYTKSNNIGERTYDGKTSQMERWFVECLKDRRVGDGSKEKIKYLSLNCRKYASNPLYMMWKAYAFNSNIILFFFFMLDYLTSQRSAITLTELANKNAYAKFQRDAIEDLLKRTEYFHGVFRCENKNKYSLAPAFDLSLLMDLLMYYSEAFPCGLIGSFILDKQKKVDSPFRFKQHFIGQAFDSEILCNTLLAIKKRYDIMIMYISKKRGMTEITGLPVKVYSSTQNGRQYVMLWHRDTRKFLNIRLDRIKYFEVIDKVVNDAESIRKRFVKLQNHIWGVSWERYKKVHVEFLIKIGNNEAYIYRRMLREKRCGIIMPVQGRSGIFKFEADVFDAREMLPWIRSFICRIVELRIDDPEIEDYFWKSVDDMYKLYLIEGENEN